VTKMIKVYRAPIEDADVGRDRGLSHRERLKIASGRRRGRPRSARLFCKDTRSARTPAEAISGYSVYRKAGAGPGFAASNGRETGKKAKMRCDMAHFCRNHDNVCATQSATTRVS
jgi:hypothetical protein